MKPDKILCCLFCSLIWPWRRTKHNSSYPLRNYSSIVYVIKRSCCAWSWTFQHKSWHISLLFWTLPGFIIILLLYYDSSKILRPHKKMLVKRGGHTLKQGLSTGSYMNTWLVGQAGLSFNLLSAMLNATFNSSYRLPVLNSRWAFWSAPRFWGRGLVWLTS